MTREAILAVVPRVVQCAYPNAWLAVSSDGSALRIGVLGRTEQLARENFSRALTEWAELLFPSAPSTEERDER